MLIRFQTPRDYIEVKTWRVSISSMRDIYMRRQFGTDYKKKLQKNLSRKTNHLSLVMEKEYLTIKISTSLIFHLSIFCRKRVFDLLNVSGSESESEHDCESKLHRFLSKL